MVAKRKLMARRVRSLLDEREWSQARLAREAKLTPSHITHILDGTLNPTINTIFALEKAFGAVIIEVADTKP